MPIVFFVRVWYYNHGSDMWDLMLFRWSEKVKGLFR